MWMSLLASAVAASNKAKVAEDLGVSRTAISLVVSGKYPASTDKIAARVIETYGRVICPHLGEEITLAECKQYHTGQVPTSSPRAMKHWRACQTCPHNHSNQGRKS
ncbi:LacI family transcriptional regulator [Nitrosospira sp. NpAV]|nr:LacI family transcriptional regulator [Nitrosospira sp. NpAV]